MILTIRRLSQTVFALLFLWFCVVTTVGEQGWQLRGWPVNWLMELDPLVGLATLLATHTLYAGLLWGILTLVLTFFLGRFFCGWVCPMGTLQQALGYLVHHRRSGTLKRRKNSYHPAQRIKYYLLLGLLCLAAGDLLRTIIVSPVRQPLVFVSLLLFAAVAWLLKQLTTDASTRPKWRPLLTGIAITSLAWLCLIFWLPRVSWSIALLQTGLLDPLPLLYRSVNLVLLPLLDQGLGLVSSATRHYSGAGLIGILFVAILTACVWRPRFYCRFVCPLGALLGICSRWSLWRMGKNQAPCKNCHLCDTHCEGACSPSETLRTAECVLCLNCREDCPRERMGYHPFVSAQGEIAVPDLDRRAVTVAMVGGLVSVPMWGLSATTDRNRDATLVRPPGALAEAEFLSRCLKCGQCMRVCPTNVIQPAGFSHGLASLWTPGLNFRMGTSGCQYLCIACGHVCPTAAIRPLTLDERRGTGTFQPSGPLRMGTAFVDRGRCLPWAMDTPCIVCQENCPVSPKAIYTRTEYRPLRHSRFDVVSHSTDTIDLHPVHELAPGRLATGDFFCRIASPGPEGPRQYRITANTNRNLSLALPPDQTGLPSEFTQVEIVIRLQKPYVAPKQCIGCGICEHECPVKGQRAIRVSAENESRRSQAPFFI